MKIQCNMLNKKINILTKNANGELYVLETDNYNFIINDYHGDCDYVPANDARVYFASYDGVPINPYFYTDFESVLKYIRNYCV